MSAEKKGIIEKLISRIEGSGKKIREVNEKSVSDIQGLNTVVGLGEGLSIDDPDDTRRRELVRGYTKLGGSPLRAAMLLSKFSKRNIEEHVNHKTVQQAATKAIDERRREEISKQPVITTSPVEKRNDYFNPAKVRHFIFSQVRLGISDPQLIADSYIQQGLVSDTTAFREFVKNNTQDYVEANK